MSENSIPKELLDAITAGIVSEAISSLKNKCVESKAARWLRDQLGIEEIHDITDKIIRSSITDAYPKHYASKSLIDEFLKDSRTQKALSNWVITPNNYKETKDKLIESIAVNSIETDLFNNFVEDIIVSIKRNRRKKFPPYALAILDDLKTLLGQFKGIDETTEQTLDIVTQIQKESLTKDDITSVFKTIAFEGSLQDSNSKKDEVDEIKSLVNKGKVIDGRKRAIELIDGLDESEKDSLCQLYRIIANSFLKEDLDQKNAIPYLKQSAALCSNDKDLYKIKALTYLLEQDLDKALVESEKLIEQNETAESVGLKANILWTMGKTEEAYLYLLDKKYEDNYSHFFNLGYAAFRNGDLQKSIDHSEECLNLNSECIEAHELLSEIYALKYQGKLRDKETFWPNEKGVNQLKKARKYASKAIEKIEEQQTGTLSRNLANRAIVNHWLGNDEDALNDLEIAEELNPNDLIILKNLARIYAVDGSFEKALNKIEKITELRGEELKDKELLFLKAELLIKTGNPDEAIKILETEIDLDNPNETSLVAYSKLILAYDRSYQTDKAEILIENAERKFSGSPIIQIAKAKHLHLIGDFDKALETLIEVEVKAKGEEKVLLKLEKADILFEKRDVDSFKKAATIYGELCDPNRNDFLLRRYALSLFNSRNYEDCLDVCENIIQNKPIKLFVRLQAEIYYLTQNFEAACNQFKWLSLKDPDNVDHSMKYAISLFRLNKKEDAFQVIRQVANRVEGSASDLLSIAYTYSSMGGYKEAAKYADKAIQAGYENPEINRAYILIWIRQIENVEGIPREYINRFQETLNSFNDRFPGYEHFFELIETSEEDIEGLKNEILERLPSQEWKRNLHELFQEKKYPIEVLSIITGRDIFSTWKTIINHPSYGLFANSGTTKELEDELRIIKKTESIIVDPVALFTINHLSKLDQFQDLFSEVLIPQIVLDILNDVKDLEERSIKSGKLALMEKDGELYKHETSSELIKEYVKELNQVINFISNSDNVKLIGQSINRNEIEVKREIKNYRENLGEITTELLCESKLRSKALYSDDYFIRIMAREEFETTSFGIRAILEVMLKDGLIKEEEFHDCLIKLIKCNYHFVNISVNTLKRLALKNGFSLNEEVLKVLQEFKRDNQIVENLMSMTWNFLKWLWDEITLDKTREDWTFALLNSISSKIEKRNIAKVLIEYSKRKFHVFEIVKKQKFKKTVNRWLESQGII